MDPLNWLAERPLVSGGEEKKLNKYLHFHVTKYVKKRTQKIKTHPYKNSKLLKLPKERGMGPLN